MNLIRRASRSRPAKIFGAELKPVSRARAHPPNPSRTLRGNVCDSSWPDDEEERARALFCVVRFDAMCLQLRPQGREMIPVARFNRAEDVHRGNIGVGEGAIVHDLFNARARGSDPCREIGQTAGSIADPRAETAKPSVRDKATLDHAAEDV